MSRPMLLRSPEPSALAPYSLTKQTLNTRRLLNVLPW